eukprot:TRINITY_DN23251_c0_g1_i1.p1 TRINITY_DN23251_c0_g1~~TRINITY_DN23251_c0_g1_i1.p1  ORF type:complete len:167 (+),score=9.70 TRINITY_DN23251_c0_g1_i1:104-604(+)
MEIMVDIVRQTSFNVCTESSGKCDSCKSLEERLRIAELENVRIKREHEENLLKAEAALLRTEPHRIRRIHSLVQQLEQKEQELFVEKERRRLLEIRTFKEEELLVQELLMNDPVRQYQQQFSLSSLPRVETRHEASPRPTPPTPATDDRVASGRFDETDNFLPGEC